MKNLILLPILFFLLENCCFISPAFSQKLRTNDLISYNDQTKSKSYQLRNPLTVLTPINYSEAISTKRDTVEKSFLETLLDFSFLSKLSGPGPFAGVGLDYPVFNFSKNFTLFAGATFSHSLDNTLKYYQTVESLTVNVPQLGTIRVAKKLDTCISCEKSKSVKMVAIKIIVQYHLPRSPFDLYLGGGINTFFGETFKTFSRGSGTFGAGWRALPCIRLGLMVNVFKQFKPSSFGAVDDGDTKNKLEFVPGAFIKVNLF